MRVMNAAALMLVVLVSAAAEERCTEELISFSACLAYVSYPPNNLTESASDKCCMAFSSAVESLCVCYLVREPLILGFPLNNTRLVSLSSICSSSSTSFSFPFLCSVSPALPPLNSAPAQTLTGAGGRGSRGKGGSSGRTLPKAGTVFYYPSFNASTLPPLITLLFSQFLAILLTLLNT